MKTLVLGIGNPIVTDDTVGLKIARLIKERKPHMDVIEACSGAMGLFDYVVDLDRLILIDSIKTEGGKPGAVYKIEIEDMKPTLDQATSHGLDIASALMMGEGLGYKMPQSVSIYAVEIKDNLNFGEECTREVAESIPLIAEKIIEEERL
ncbi:MAG: hydrogenase maturation protease [Chloroflexota bacterium]|nr:hydrogenase maturation protease [Chloroflexota bacterium]